MKASAIVVTYRTGAALADCLASMAAEAQLAEIVIVDNGNGASETRLLDDFAASDRRATLLRGHGNVGFATACNMGAKRATGEVLVFVNPDVTLHPGAVEDLTRTVLEAEGPALVGGDLRSSDGTPERGARRDALTLWSALVSFSGMSRLEGVVPAFRDYNRHRDPLPASAAPVGAVSGALMAMRRGDFEAIGGFDEGYFLHVEDLDLCRRAREAGWRVLFQPGPHGVHLRSTSAAEPGAVARHKALGAARYFRKFARGPIERAAAEIAGAMLEANARLIRK